MEIDINIYNPKTDYYHFFSLSNLSFVRQDDGSFTHPLKMLL